MKKFLSILLALTLCLSMLSVPAFAADTWDGTVANAFAEGDGKEATPYIINTAGQLAYFAKVINDSATNASYKEKYYALGADIDLNNTKWTPIGNSVDYFFCGKFNGNGHVIKNLNVTMGDTDIVAGLFGVIGNATVKNVGIDTATITTNTTTTTSSLYAGVLIGYAKEYGNSAISECFVRNATINIKTAKGIKGAGALIGYTFGKRADCSDCYARGITFVDANSVTSSFSSGTGIGTLIGGQPGGIMSNCYAADMKKGPVYNGSALFRTDQNPTVTNCYYYDCTFGVNYDKLSSLITETALKAIPAELNTNNAFTADTQSKNSGYPVFEWENAWNGTIANGFAEGNGKETTPYIINTAGQLAYFAKVINDSATNTSYRDKYYALGADINLNNQAWTPIGNSVDYFFCGKFNGNGHVIKNLNVTMGDSDIVASLFGVIGNATVKNVGIDTATITTNTTTTTSSLYVGVLIGYAKDYGNSAITECFVRNATINIKTAKGIQGSGALIGYVNGKRADCSDCYVRGITFVQAYSGTDSFAAGMGVGTLIGGKPGGTISNCYAADMNKGPVYNGGALFRTDQNPTVTNCYYYNCTFGNNQDKLSSSIGESELKAIPAGLNSNDVFTADTHSKNSGYPILKWENAVDTIATTLNAALNKINIFNADTPVNGIVLDTIVAVDGVNIPVAWSSGNKAVITDTGVVHPSTEAEQTVTMTATVTYSDKSKSKDFTITVPKVMPYIVNNIEVTGEDGIVDNALVGGKSVSAVNLTRYAADGNATLIVALFNGDAFVNCTVTSLTDSTVTRYGDKNVALTNPLALPENIEATHKVKVFVLGRTTLVPLAMVKEIGKRNENPALYIASDSIYQSWAKTTHTPQFGLGDVLNVYLNDNVDVYNHAVAGESSKSWAYKYFSKLNGISEGDYLLISMAHNDQKDSDADRSTTVNLAQGDTAIDYTKSNTYVRYLQMYVDKARSVGANVIFVTSAERAVTTQTLKPQVTAMKLFAEEKGIPCIDLNADSLALFQGTANASNTKDKFYRYFLIWGEGSKSGFTKDDMTARFGSLGTNFDKSAVEDTTHFNMEGAAVMGNFVALGLKTAGIPLSLYLSNRCQLKTVNEVIADSDCMAGVITASDYVK